MNCGPPRRRGTQSPPQSLSPPPLSPKGPKNLWEPTKKLKLHTWKDASKATKVKLQSKEVELKESRSIFARLLLTARAEINLEEVVGKYEFSCVPGSLCSADGSLLPCNDKSKLLPLLEALPKMEVGHSEINGSLHQLMMLNQKPS